MSLNKSINTKNVCMYIVEFEINGFALQFAIQKCLGCYSKLNLGRPIYQISRKNSYSLSSFKF